MQPTYRSALTYMYCIVEVFFGVHGPHNICLHTNQYIYRITARQVIMVYLDIGVRPCCNISSSISMYRVYEIFKTCNLISSLFLDK